MTITKQDILAITDRLKQPDVEKIILFGSFAMGTSNTDSDLDLIVVTSDPEIPDSFSSRMKVVLRVNQYISDYKKKYPIDLVVYTKGMYQKFIELNSSFYKEISKTGRILYEKDNN